jgi:hypothetical protein
MEPIIASPKGNSVRPGFQMNLQRITITTLLLLLLTFSARDAIALEHVSLRRDGHPLHLSGKIVTDAEDGGLLLMTTDGMMWAVQPEDLISRKSDDQPFVLLTREEIAAKALAELPDGFKVHHTAHYVICYNTSPAYAQWCGTLYERLYKAFFAYWGQRGFELHDPESPLLAVVFEDKSSYVRFTRAELGDAAEAIVGFYSPISNRVNMYDLTGLEGVRRPGERIGTAARISQLLSQEGALATVATIVHEATHQLAYNCGLQTRLAANPVWVSEGLAMFFETPDLSNTKGWSGIGGVNRARLVQFHQYLRNRPDDSLTTLLSDDRRFHDPKSATSAYAESWALNYYLLRTRSKDYVHYLKLLSQKPPAVADPPEKRLSEFTTVFGDLQQFDTAFLRYIRGVR